MKVLAKAGLPPPSRQFEIRDRARLLARVDFAYPSARLVIEADGYRYHSGRADWQRDLMRRNALTSRGWRVLTVTWSDVTDRPHEVVAEVNRALGRCLWV